MSSSNLPNKLRDIPVFIGNPWVRVINLLDDVEIVAPVTAEVWFSGVKHPEIVVNPVVAGQTITVTLTPEQIALLPSRNASLNIKFGSKYVLQQKLTPTYEGDIPEDVIEDYDTPGLGVFRVSYYSDETNAKLSSEAAVVAAEERIKAEKSAENAYDYMVAAQNASVGAVDPAGTFNAATGVATQYASATNPAATFSPTTVSNKPKGYFLTVDVPGDTSISGTTVSAQKGDTFRSNGVGFGWTHIPYSDAALEKIENYEAKIILAEDGRFLIKGDGDWIGFELTPAGVTRTGPIEVASIKIDGSPLEPDQFAEKEVFNRLNNNFGLAEDGTLNFVDQYGNVSGLIDPSGHWNLPNLISSAFAAKQVSADKLTAAGLVFQNENSAYKLVFTDELGNIGLDLTPKVPRKFGMLADVNHYFIYGQSLSVGQEGQPLIHTYTQNYVYTFNKGPWMYLYESDPTKYDSLRLSTEAVQETPCGAMGGMIVQSVNALGLPINGTTFKYDVLVSAAGQGGASLASLSKPGAAYSRFYNGIVNGKSLSNAAGKTYNAPAVLWMQGENETTTKMPESQYKDALRKLKSDMNADIKAVNPNQKNDLVFIVYQLASFNTSPGGAYPNIALAMLDLCLSEPGYYLGPVMYPYLYKDDVHLLNGEQYARVGALAGYIMEKVVVEGVEWKPIHIVETQIEGNFIDVKFHVPVKPLVIDTVLVTDPGNKGFRLFNGSTEQTINSVEVVRPDTVRITTASPASVGMTLTYAINGTSGKSGPTNGARGNLRDSQGDTLKYHPSTENYALHNWCPIFSHILK